MRVVVPCATLAEAHRAIDGWTYAFADGRPATVSTWQEIQVGPAINACRRAVAAKRMQASLEAMARERVRPCALHTLNSRPVLRMRP